MHFALFLVRVGGEGFLQSLVSFCRPLWSTGTYVCCFPCVLWLVVAGLHAGSAADLAEVEGPVAPPARHPGGHPRESLRQHQTINFLYPFFSHVSCAIKSQILNWL